MNDSVLLRDLDEGVATLTLNRPDKLNALSAELRLALVDAFEALRTDREAKVVILTGNGRAFSAGIDLRELGGESGGGQTNEQTVVRADIVNAMRSIPQPIIGAVNGFAITGGFEIALACDVLLASTEASFADTHARVGILPGWGLSQRLPRAIGIYRAKELSLTGNFLPAERAEAWGLVSRVLPPDELLPAARRLAADMLSSDGDTMAAYKRLIDEGFDCSLADGLGIEAKASARHMRSVTQESIAQRRADIQSRGRAQQRS